MSKPKEFNSVHAGTTVKSENCVVTVSDGVEVYGIQPSEINNKMDYAIYRLLGSGWRTDNSNVITIQSLISDDYLEVTGHEFDQWFFKKEINNNHLEENGRIRGFFNRLSEAYKEHKNNYGSRLNPAVHG